MFILRKLLYEDTTLWQNRVCRGALLYCHCTTVCLYPNREILECFEHLSTDVGCRAIVLSGAGKNFTAGRKGVGSGRGGEGGGRVGGWGSQEGEEGSQCYTKHTTISRSPGLDLMDFAESFSSSMEGDLARKAFVLRRFIKSYQASFTAIEKVWS